MNSGRTLPSMQVVLSGVLMGVCCLVIDAQQPDKKGEPNAGIHIDYPAKIDVVADKPEKDGKQRIVVDLTLEKDWHAFANPPGSEDLLPAQTTMTVTSKMPLTKVEIIYPKGEAYKDALLGTWYIYTGKVRLEGIIERAAGDSGPLLVTVRVQPVNGKKGLMKMPANLQKTVE